MVWWSTKGKQIRQRRVSVKVSIVSKSRWRPLLAIGWLKLFAQVPHWRTGVRHYSKISRDLVWAQWLWCGRPDDVGVKRDETGKRGWHRIMHD